MPAATDATVLHDALLPPAQSVSFIKAEEE